MLPKPVRKDFPTIMDGLVVRYQFGNHYEISASRNGVIVDLPLIGTEDEWSIVLHYLNRARLQHTALSRGQAPLPEENDND